MNTGGEKFATDDKMTRIYLGRIIIIQGIHFIGKPPLDLLIIMIYMPLLRSQLLHQCSHLVVGVYVYSNSLGSGR
jgi:hypothetical protein